MRRRLALSCVLILVTSTISLSAPSGVRLEAVDTVNVAVSQLNKGDRAAAKSTVERALKMDPNLASANLVRAEIALKDEEWELARKQFAKGLEHLDETDQPLSPIASNPDERKWLKGNCHLMLGFVYSKLAERAHGQGNVKLSNSLLISAKSNFVKGLPLSPSPHWQKIGRSLLEGLRNVPSDP